MKSVTRLMLISGVCTAAFQAAPAMAQDENFTGVDDNVVIVTARKQSENLQEAPITVAVTTSETIDRLALNSIVDISKTTAGITFDDSLGRDANRPVVRGQASILGESGVANFIDGVYFTGSIGDYDVDTIERIEIVKGPQSALYGRNTYSGAINIVSKLPTDRIEGRVTADISEHDRYEISAGLRGPITDSISAGISGRYYDFGGEYTNQFDGTKIGEQSSYSFSGQLAFDDGGPLTIKARGYYNNTDDGIPAIFSTSTFANNCFFDNGSLYGGGGRYFCGTIQPQQINTNAREQFADFDQIGFEAETINASLRIDYELTDQLTLTSLTGYNDRDDSLVQDGDYSPDGFQTAVFARFPIGAPTGFGPRGPIFPFGFVGTTVDFSFAQTSDTEDVSQELRLAYDGDRIDLLIGGYYFDQRRVTQDIRDVPDGALATAGASFGARFAEQRAICAANPNCGSIVPLFGPSLPNSRDRNQLDIRNLAVFGSIAFDITDDITLGVEARYAEEDIEQSVLDFNEGDPVPPAETAEATFKSFTPRVTLDWQFAQDHLFYAIFAQGEKPGGFNGVAAINAGFPTYAEEQVDSYEIGFKNSFFDRRVTFNVAAFRSEIEGYQLTQNVRADANAVSAIVNAGDARINGLEIEMQVRPSDRFTFTANYALADTRFTSGFDENDGVLNDVADDGLVNCSIGDQFPEVSGCQSLFGSIDGRRIPRAPVHQVFADVDYQAPLGGSEWSFFTGANVSLTSSSFAQVANLAETGAAAVVDARLGFENGRFKIMGYVKNLFEEDAVGSLIRFADADRDFRRNFVAGLRPGRRFGVVLSAKY